jgi:NTE family protein
MAKKIGLALGGGAARGLAHIGVLEVFEKEGVPVDIVAGTSAGAIIGALHAAGVTAAKMKKYVLGFDSARRRRMVDLTLPRSGFINGEKIIKEMVKLMGADKAFGELAKPFACVACDILRGEEVVLDKGKVSEAVHASIAVPIIFSAVKLEGRYLVDGGIVNQIPVSVTKAMGAEFIIGVNVLPLHTRRVDSGRGPDEEPPGLITVMLNTIDIANSCRAEASLAGADIVISPNTASFKPVDFARAEELVLQGEMAAIDSLLAIKRAMARW